MHSREMLGDHQWWECSRESCGSWAPPEMLTNATCCVVLKHVSCHTGPQQFSLKYSSIRYLFLVEIKLCAGLVT